MFLPSESWCVSSLSSSPKSGTWVSPPQQLRTRPRPDEASCIRSNIHIKNSVICQRQPSSSATTNLFGYRKYNMNMSITYVCHFINGSMTYDDMSWRVSITHISIPKTCSRHTMTCYQSFRAISYHFKWHATAMSLTWFTMTLAWYLLTCIDNTL
jgi:hypothetical protein